MSTTEPAPRPSPDESSLLEILSRGELEVRGRLVDASNATLLATVRLDGMVTSCVYKPIAGERPLWDFPSRTLARREAAAYLVSTATGWDLVPPTVLRQGPFGPGSVQWWVDDGAAAPGADPLPPDPGGGLVDILPASQVPPDWRHVLDAEGMDGLPVVLAHADDAALRRMAIFDVVANNADRKGGHVLRDLGGRVFGVDHGLTFNAEDKLRTVLWGWAGEPLPDDACDVLAALATDLQGEGALRAGLLGLLARSEIDQTARRADELLSAGCHPRPAPGRPAIPWPAF